MMLLSKARNQVPRLLSNPEMPGVLVRACGNSHSNHTDWPWYSHVAPASWWIAQHVRKGRENLDFSERETYSTWRKRDKLESLCALISNGTMPPRLYAAMHPEAKLTEENKKIVCAWVKEQTILQNEARKKPMRGELKQCTRWAKLVSGHGHYSSLSKSRSASK